MNLNGYKKEWSTFIMKDNNFISLLNTDFSKKHLLSRSYNEISNIKELCRSNKGSQRYLSLTLDACQTYFSEIKFEGETKETKDIASLLYKFTRLQKTFDDAKEIRKEYLKLRNQNKIQDHLLEEKLTDNIFSEIEDEKEEILSNTTTAINNLSNVINNKFTFEFLSKYDATNFVLGKYCSCCSHLEAVGFGVVKASILHPDCQNLVIRDKSGKIIAKSTLYINRKEGYGLFNTIEIDENITNKEKKYIYTKYIQAISLFTEKYNQKNYQNPLLQINVGTHANDLLNELEKYHKESETNLKGIDFSIYGKDGLYHEGDWKQGQLIVWKKK